MANLFVFANLARSSLAGAMNTTDISLSVQAGGGAQFPSPTTGQQFAMTLTDAATGLLKEIVYCTAKVGDTMTVVRGQEGYPALNWAPGDPIANLWTAGQAAAMLQTGQFQSQSPNYAVDVGTTNAYVGSYSPTISVPVPGMPLRLKIANTNSGPSTFDPGSGLANIVLASGASLSGGELKQNFVYEFMWNGAAYELMAPVSSSTPVGVVQAFAGGTVPAGYLFCGGQSLLRASYPDLFAAIGVVYGAVDGTHFNLPDLQGRTIAGLDSTGTRLNTPYVTPNGNTLGATGGSQSETTTLTSSGSTSGSQTVTASGTTSASNQTRTFDGGGNTGVPETHQHTVTVTGTTSGALAVASTGTTATVTNVQPTMVMYWIIKATA